ncbi:MAG: hypothetical protein L3J29_00415 [Cyclobacteriaceae bacterium]|nr:hypothetical protein [Cyclobacteriaceae bacterium]
MDKTLSEGIKNLAQALNLYKVKHMFVGGVAVGFYAKPRPSTNLPKGIDYDVDIWYLATTENFVSLINAIGKIRPELKMDLNKIVFDPLKTFLKFDLDNFHFDFLPELKAFDYKDFNKCYENREVAQIDKIEVSMISIDDLILNKKATGRSKDKEDIENLNKNSLKGFSR